MDPRWFILADDLTGAADSAIAFARRGLPAKVVWGEARPEQHADAMALAYDAATRELDAAAAARQHGEALRRFLRPGVHVFKKIDSTLRGNPAEEIAAMLDVLHARAPRMRVVIAPAFPAMGRTVRDGQIFVHGVPLPFTEFWPASREQDLAVLMNLLDTVGVHARHLSLSTVRGDPAALSSGFANGVAVCDAETVGDLERIASASLEDDAATVCIGSAGFAHALAQIASRASGLSRGSHRCAVVTNGALIVVGSRTQASRAALTQLRTLGDLEGVSVSPALLMVDPLSSAAVELANGVGRTLARGVDVVVDISQSASAQDAGNPQLAAALARLLAAPARHASALVATGGETAAALLTRLGVEGLRLVDEIEPGIPLGLTLGEISVPAVTKAGGFGNEECLKRILSRLRFIRQTGAVA
jgi:D-threonate/D-erythronate kinase